jgi:hypothetical protein
MYVTEYLKANGIEALKENYGIRVKEYPDVYILNYDQIESPKTDPITIECRSLVLDKNFEVVSRSFDRFFNHGEANVEFDFTNSLAMEKVDGSIIGLAKYPDNRWYFRTRGMAYAESEMPSGRTYIDAILECIGVKDIEELQRRLYLCDPELTFIFEFVSPENRIVTRYEKPELVLLAARLKNGEYPSESNGKMLNMAVSLMSKYWHNGMYGFNNLRACKMFDTKTLDDVNTLVDNLTDLQEGFVVLDQKTGNRIKIKDLAYLKVHKIRGSTGTPSPADVAELIVENEQDEFLNYFPEYKPMFDKVKSKWDELTQAAEALYNEHSAIENQKDFAMAVKSSPLSGVLFTTRANKTTFQHSLASAKTSMKVKVLLASI